MSWRTCCGQPCPRSQVVFLCQVLVLSIVVLTSLLNLSWGRGDCHSDALWASLLGGCIGLSTPGPVVDWRWPKKRKQQQEQQQELDNVDSGGDVTQQLEHELLPREYEVTVQGGVGDPTASGGSPRSGSGGISLQEELV